MRTKQTTKKASARPDNVRTYSATFTGRQVGAIGKFHGISTHVEARNEDEARLSLYDRFEHISDLELKILGTIPVSDSVESTTQRAEKPTEQEIMDLEAQAAGCPEYQDKLAAALRKRELLSLSRSELENVAYRVGVEAPICYGLKIHLVEAIIERETKANETTDDWERIGELQKAYVEKQQLDLRNQAAQLAEALRDILQWFDAPYDPKPKSLPDARKALAAYEEGK